MRRDSILIGLGLLFLLVVGVWALGMNRSGSTNPDQLDDETASAQSSGAAKPEDVGKRCGTQAVYDLVERELFRQAAATRGSDGSEFDRLANYATVRVQNPVLKRRDDGLETLICGGRVSIDLPPGVAVAGGRRTLSSDIDYAVQPSSDGTGQVVTLSNADGIVVPLATLGRSSATASDTAALEPDSSNEEGAESGSMPAPAPVRPIPAPVATTSPSFNCGAARTAGERAVCADSGLAAMDRQMSAQYVRASRVASPEERQILATTRNRFLSYRDSCRSNSCIAEAYSGRMREIDDIMTGRWSDR